MNDVIGTTAAFYLAREGHEVTVVEAHRTQERQNFLFEQGRSRPGNVVTWTRNSNHTTGRAVDVMIDVRGNFFYTQAMLL